MNSGFEEWSLKSSGVFITSYGRHPNEELWEALGTYHRIASENKFMQDRVLGADKAKSSGFSNALRLKEP